MLHYLNRTVKPTGADIFCSVAHTLTPPHRRLATFQPLLAPDWLAVRVRESCGGRDSNNPLVLPAPWTDRHGRPRPGQTAERPRQHPLTSQRDAFVSGGFGWSTEPQTYTEHCLFRRISSLFPKTSQLAVPRSPLQETHLASPPG